VLSGQPVQSGHNRVRGSCQKLSTLELSTNITSFPNPKFNDSKTVFLFSSQKKEKKKKKQF